MAEDPREYCCVGMMRAMSYDWPLSNSIQVQSDMTMRHIGMDIVLAKRTASGAISRSGQMRLMINYCPWCGKPVTGAAEPEYGEEEDDVPSGG